MPRFLLFGAGAVTAMLLSGCGPSHEEVLRERARQFAVGLVQENYEACIQLTDPRFVQQKGIIFRNDVAMTAAVGRNYRFPARHVFH